MIQIKDSAMETHGYLNEIKSSGEPRYTGYYKRYADKYRLPESAAPLPAAEPALEKEAPVLS